MIGSLDRRVSALVSAPLARDNVALLTHVIAVRIRFLLLPLLTGLTWLLVGSAVCLAHGVDTPAPAKSPLAGGIYVGVLPCADCQGLQYRLHLRTDGAYVLESGYLGKPAGPANPGAVLGAWTASADGKTLELRRHDEPTMFFAIVNSETLRKLDTQGRPIDSRVNHELTRSHGIEKLRPLLRLQGMFRYRDTAGQSTDPDLGAGKKGSSRSSADVSEFQECESAARFPVAPSGDSAALERAYRSAGSSSAAGVSTDQELLVTIDARISAWPSPDGDKLEDTIMVERLVAALSGKTCANPMAAGH